MRRRLRCERKDNIVSMRGERMTLERAVERYGNGASYVCVYARLRLGWEVERAVTTPLVKPKITVEERRRRRRVSNKLTYHSDIEASRKKARLASAKWRRDHPDRAVASHAKHYQRHRKERLDYQARYYVEHREARSAYAKVYNRSRKAGSSHREAVGEALQKALACNPIYASAKAAVRSGLPVDVRDDVISRLVLGILEGEFNPDQLAQRAKKFITTEMRRFHERSLDARIPGTTLKLIDTIAAP